MASGSKCNDSKKAKVDLVNKLRTTTLTEADFNFNNKFLGKHTIAHAEKHELLAKEQYGSRKGKNSIEHTIHKRFTFDIMHQTRINRAICSNDAKSCYNRMRCNNKAVGPMGDCSKM
jgi:hypothetical protein